MSSRIAILSALMLTLILAGPAQSYRLLGYKWSAQPFQYYINPANSDVSEDAAVSAIRKGAKVWHEWCKPAYKGLTTTHAVRNDSQNTVFFRKKVYGALATTYIFRKQGEILDFDMVFWDKAWKFYTGSKDCVDGFYITDIAAHEFGHAIGLGHSKVEDATMYRHCGWCNNQIRTLATDDIDAVNELYGPITTSTVASQ
jgi:hypothetical protein